MVDLWGPAATELSGMSARHRVAFAAATVQRCAPGFTGLTRWRRADHEFFAETVEFLWAMAAGGQVTGMSTRRARLNRFREMRKRRESGGKRFFVEQAVYLLDYALDTVEGDPEGVTNTIKAVLHMMDGFDQDLGESDNVDRELGHERQVLEWLRRSPALTVEDVVSLRRQASVDSEMVRAAVQRRRR